MRRCLEATNLWRRTEVPVILVLTVQSSNKTRSQDQRIGSPVAAGLDNKDADIRILSKAACNNKTGCASAHDNVVEGLVKVNGRHGSGYSCTTLQLNMHSNRQVDSG
jgi:hypothetical protein